MTHLLTYRNLPPAGELVGRPLGCDPDGHPYRVVAVHRYDDGRTEIELEPWPVPPVGQPDPAFGPAMQYGEAVYRLQHQPPTAQ